MQPTRKHLFLVLLARCACILASLTSDLVVESHSWDYSSILSPGRYAGLSFDDLPGFTRSTYRRNWALVTPESRTFGSNPLWGASLTAHLISPAVGANFAMYLANMGANGTAAAPAPGVERFLLVLDGVVTVSAAKHKPVELHANQFAYLPASLPHTLSTVAGAGLVLYERRYAVSRPAAPPRFLHGDVDAQPVLPVPGEVFVLRKLLPQSADFDFNVHVMDFLPGEYLNVKEVHYNQHGLLLLAGKGIYRLGDEWMAVQTGDAIWMAPYVVQWYAALRGTPSRYLLYKDTTLDPLEG